jgi:hypothetical protein
VSIVIFVGQKYLFEMNWICNASGCGHNNNNIDPICAKCRSPNASTSDCSITKGDFSHFDDINIDSDDGLEPYTMPTELDPCVGTAVLITDIQKPSNAKN